MAVNDGQSYGKALPDQVDKLAALSHAQLDLLADTRELFRERVALEREYATKLQVLAKKAADKKSKKIAGLVLGNEPTKSWNEDVIKQSTLDNAYSQLISSITDTAQDVINLSDALNSQVADVLKALERRHEEANKKQTQDFQKMLSDRDRTYGERLKSKQKYNDECNEVELYRNKQARSTDDRHAERAAKQYESQQVDMLNSKNMYLISNAIANKFKSKFYDEDLPMLEDQYQILQAQLLTNFSKIILHAQALQSRHLDTLKSRVAVTESAFNDLNPSKDQDLVIDYNMSPFSAPADWSFEPCATHYDTGDMSVEAAPKVYLQNRLSKCRGKLQELRPVIDAKRKEVDQLHRLVTAYSADHGLGKADEVSDNYLEAQRQLAFYANSECVLMAEIETIEAALGGDEGAQSPHAFKSSSFSIPTQCAYCKSTIWGLSRQGKTCKACGAAVHSKCELKLPANCPGGRGHNRNADSISVTSSVLIRGDSRASSIATPMTPTPSSFAQNDLSPHAHEEHEPTARVLFDFTPTSPYELAVSEGTLVRVIEGDDGSGWVKVSDNSGGKGLVPASYLELTDAVAPEPSTISPSSTHPQGSGKFVRAIYGYQAQGPDELTLQEGELVELTGGASGGQNYGDGWWEGIDTKGRQGIFPSNYVQIVP